MNKNRSLKTESFGENSPVPLQILSSFGATLSSNSVAVIDDRHILYICGKYICLNNISSKGDSSNNDSSQMFFHGTKEGKQIKAICASPSSSRTRGIAFAETESLDFHLSSFLSPRFFTLFHNSLFLFYLLYSEFKMVNHSYS